MASRSSGWTASSQPHALISSAFWPVKERQLGWSSPNSPEARVVQTTAAVASISDRKRSSLWRRADSPT